MTMKRRIYGEYARISIPVQDVSFNYHDKTRVQMFYFLIHRYSRRFHISSTTTVYVDSD